MKEKNHPETPRPAQTGITLSPEATKIASVVREDPGCNLKQARDRTGLGSCVFETALEEATQAGTVRQVPHGRETLLFPDYEEVEKVAPQLIALKDEHTSKLYWYLYDRDEIADRQEVLRHAEQAYGWSIHRARWRMHQLEEAGLLKASQGWHDRRQIVIRTVPVHPHVLRVLDHTDDS